MQEQYIYSLQDISSSIMLWFLHRKQTIVGSVMQQIHTHTQQTGTQGSKSCTCLAQLSFHNDIISGAHTHTHTHSKEERGNTPAVSCPLSQKNLSVCGLAYVWAHTHWCINPKNVCVIHTHLPLDKLESRALLKGKGSLLSPSSHPTGSSSVHQLHGRHRRSACLCRSQGDGHTGRE